jgi:hypothetical protein
MSDNKVVGKLRVEPIMLKLLKPQLNAQVEVEIVMGMIVFLWQHSQFITKDQINT